MQTTGPPRPLHLLLAEDSADDAFLFTRALKMTQLNAGLSHVPDGQEAIRYVRGEGLFADRNQHPFPDIIFADLKMPGTDGFQFLEWLKHHSRWAVIPIIVFSSSYLEKDVARAYQLGANAFLAKPSNLNELADLLLLTQRFWSRCERPAPPLQG